MLTSMSDMEGCTDGVRVMSRRMVRPLPLTPANGGDEEIHLTPWDLRLLTVDYFQRGILLPKPPVSGDDLAGTLASSFARALGRLYAFAGRLASHERGSDGTVTVSLRCTGEGAEFVHAAAPGVAMADITASIHIPPVVRRFFPMNHVLGADAAIESLPVMSVQVTELADGVFVGMSMNHAVGDGTNLWEFFNTWSEINRGIGGGIGDDLSSSELSTPAPVFRRWFAETSPVPIPLPFSKLQHLADRARGVAIADAPAVEVCFFTFSGETVRKLKARANGEMSGTATGSICISSLQAVLAHLWRAVCRARRLPPDQRTSYYVIVGCRGRVRGVPPAGYVGNALVRAVAESTAGEVGNTLGRAAWLLNRAVAAFDEARVRDSLRRWVREPEFSYMAMGSLSAAGGAALFTGSSPRFDVFGNDFGWGRPVAVRSGSANKVDGKATVFEGPDKAGSISLEVCLRPEVLARLVADEEFMDAVSLPASD